MTNTRIDDIRKRALKDLQQADVLLDGHFDYGNGYHGRLYVNPHMLFCYPSTVWRLAQDLLDILPFDITDKVTAVVGPVTGGALQAHTLAGLLAAAAHEGLLAAAHDLADGGLAIALAEGVLRFGVGARVFLDELLERDGIDIATALFSESTGRVLVAVPREEDVKFTRLCEGRGYPVIRIGVTDSEPALEVQGLFAASVDELATTFREPLRARFA